MRCQTHHTVPINKEPVAFLGMGVIKSNSRRLGRETVNKFGLTFLLPPTKEITPRSGHGINSTHRTAWASQHGCTGHKQAWFIGWYRDSSDLINRALGVKDDCRTLHPGFQQHRITAQESSRQDKEMSLGPTQLYHNIGVGLQILVLSQFLAGCVERIQCRKKALVMYQGSPHLTSNNHGTQRRPLITSLQGAGHGKRHNTE